MAKIVIPPWPSSVAAGLACLCACAVAAPRSAHAAAPEAAALAGDYLIAAIVAGATLFFACAGFVFLVAGARARQAESRLAEEAASNARQLDLAQAIMRAEPQALVVYEKEEAPRLLAHSLDPALGVPAKERHLLRFATWAERGMAGRLEEGMRKLRESGEPFEMTVRTLAGALLEAEGRASGGCCYLKIRDIARTRREIVSLLAQAREMKDALDARDALLDALPMPAWLRGPDGRLTWVNRAYAAAVEAGAREEAIAEQIELLEQRQRRQIEQEIEKGAMFRQRLQTIVGGGRRTFEVVSTPSGRGAAGAAIDVAQLESARDKLSRQMAAHARTLDRVATAVAIYGPDQRLSFYNQAYLEFWGLDADWLDLKPKLGEILDKLRLLRKLPEQTDYRAWRDKQLQAYESTEPREECWHLPDGRSVLVVIDQRPDGGVTFLYDDVTEKFALESRFNTLATVQRETLEHLREGVAVFGSDGRLRLFNAAFAAMWRLDVNDLESQPHIGEVAQRCRPVDGADDDPWDSARLAVTSVNEKREAFEAVLDRADGGVIACAGLPLPDGGTLLTYIDITDRKRFEKALIERNEALKAADEMKNLFLSNISRELRTPLTNITGFSEMLLNPMFGRLNPKQREYVNDIRASSATLRAIIDDIIDLAVIDAGALELQLAPVDVREIVEAAALSVRDRLARSEMKLHIRVEEEVERIVADGQRLTQILFNLLSNAIGFSEQGSDITLNCRREGAYAAFTVRDMGCGIPAEYRETVFERFESRPQGSKHRGPGLGLPLVKSLVEMHGGGVDLDSSPGAGTTVKVLIPISGPRRISHEAEHDPGAAVPASPGANAISAIFSQ